METRNLRVAQREIIICEVYEYGDPAINAALAAAGLPPVTSMQDLEKIFPEGPRSIIHFLTDLEFWQAVAALPICEEAGAKFGEIWAGAEWRVLGMLGIKAN